MQGIELRERWKATKDVGDKKGSKGPENGCEMGGYPEDRGPLEDMPMSAESIKGDPVCREETECWRRHVRILTD